MIIEIDKSNLDLLYNKAKESYNECIDFRDNGFLQQEVDTPLKFIILKETEVKVVFSAEMPESFILEVYLELYANCKIIGKCLYFENEKGDSIDDSLVFY